MDFVSVCTSHLTHLSYFFGHPPCTVFFTVCTRGSSMLLAHEKKGKKGSFAAVMAPSLMLARAI